MEKSNVRNSRKRSAEVGNLQSPIKLEIRHTRARTKLGNVTNYVTNPTQPIDALKTKELNNLFTSLQVSVPLKKKKLSETNNFVKGVPYKEVLSSFTPENSMVVINSEENVNEEINYFSTIEEILGYYYSNIVERLGLSFIPKCSSDFHSCKKTHFSKKSKLPDIADEVIALEAKIYSHCDRYDQYFSYLDSLINNDVFVGCKVMSDLLEKILSCNFDDNLDEKLNNSYILSECGNFIEKILYKFPPCNPLLQNQYKKLIMESFKLETKLLDKYELKNGLFHGALLILNELMDNMENDDLDQMKNVNKIDNFYEWQKIEDNKQEIVHITRNDRMERIFIILHFLVKIAETDFGLWNLKYSKNLKENINNTNRPIAAVMFWPLNENLGEINDYVKRVISVFIKSIIMKYPVDKIKILSKILNLISQITVLSELNNDDNNLIEYPRRHFTRTEILCRELFKVVDTLQYYYINSDNRIVHLYQSILSHLKTPFMRMLLCNLVINKINCYNNNEINVKRFYKDLNNQNWSSFEQGKPENDPTLKSKELYPVFNELNKSAGKKLSMIYLSDYLNILYFSIKSYMEYTRLADVIKSTKHKNHNKKNAIVSTNTLNIEESIELFYENFESVRSLNLNIGCSVSKQNFCDKILVDDQLVIRYVEDSKYFFKVVDLLKLKSQKYSSEVLKLKNYLENV